MLTVAFLANEFPSPIERYVSDEIEELERRGVHVIAGSVRRPKEHAGLMPEVVLQCFEPSALRRAAWLLIRRWRRIAPLFRRIAFQGNEGFRQRLKAVAHTLLGACYAEKLEGRGLDHIHVHHGYFGSWVGMVAARLLGVPFSITLHGSDLLLHATYLDTKLEHCAFCRTISEYNRRYVLQHYPRVAPEKVFVLPLGVEVPEPADFRAELKAKDDPILLLAVGRLHAVKDHAFLVRACANLLARDVAFRCLIAGEGPEHSRLESMIRALDLEGRVTLLGHVQPAQRNSLYAKADIVVLTSRSEGVPLVLMEAMARGKIVLAPAITGIPELVISGKTGFLYEPGSIDDFVARLLFLRAQMQNSIDPHELHAHVLARGLHLEWIRREARMHVKQNFNRHKNLQLLAQLFLQRIAPQTESTPDESLVLQQI